MENSCRSLHTFASLGSRVLMNASGSCVVFFIRTWGGRYGFQDMSSLVKKTGLHPKRRTRPRSTL